MRLARSTDPGRAKPVAAYLLDDRPPDIRKGDHDHHPIMDPVLEVDQCQHHKRNGQNDRILVEKLEELHRRNHLTFVGSTALRTFSRRDLATRSASASYPRVRRMARDPNENHIASRY